jgi:hypothetical protein
MDPVQCFGNRRSDTPHATSPVLFALISIASFLACAYKAEPEDGMQYCGPAGECPDGYECRTDSWYGRCYHTTPGSGAGGLASTGGVWLSASGGTGGTIIAATGGIVAKPSTGGISTHVAGSGGSVVVKPGTGGTLSYPVTFQFGQATGVLTGYGWLALGSLDSVTDPTCGYSATPITSTTACADVTNWNAPNALCVSGFIPAVPANATLDYYNHNWGIQIGVNATVTSGAIGRAFSTISASISGAPPSGFRIELHRSGDIATTPYCFDGVTSGMQVPLTGFNTACWDNSGIQFTPADAPKIDQVGVQVSSMSTAITLTNMCLNSFTFGN